LYSTYESKESLGALDDKDMQWCADGGFWGIFCILYFQQAACSTFQTCILNSHYGHTMCASMADIQSATVEISEEKKKIEEETTG